MSRNRIHPNAIIVFLFGLVLALNEGIAHHSVFLALVFLAVAAVASVLVNRVKTRKK